MNKNVCILAVAVISLAIGAAAGYYFGYDIGFEQAVQELQQIKPL